MRYVTFAPDEFTATLACRGEGVTDTSVPHPLTGIPSSGYREGDVDAVSS